MPTTPTSGSRKFDEFRERLAADSAVVRELESAMRVNVDRVNPTDPGNRFVVGGAVEWLIAAAAWSVDVLTIPGGHGARGFDLLDLQNAARGMWSVKAQTSKNKGQWRLTNGLGGSGKGFVEPTVFVSPNLPGMTYVDPQIHTGVSTMARQSKDATVLPFGPVLEHAKANPQCVIPLGAPKNEGRGQENPFLAYTETIISPAQFPRLASMFSAARPPQTSTVADIGSLIAMRDGGSLTPDQFDSALKKITESN